MGGIFRPSLTVLSWMSKNGWSNQWRFSYDECVFWKEKKNHHHHHHHDLYYLLPGMGRGARRRFRRNITVGFLVGLLVSSLMAWLFWLWYK
ncbi:MAG: hypothetical protein ABSF38_20235 [Verrucomicrobiota bacterium]